MKSKSVFDERMDRVSASLDRAEAAREKDHAEWEARSKKFDDDLAKSCDAWEAELAARDAAAEARSKKFDDDLAKSRAAWEAELAARDAADKERKAEFEAERKARDAASEKRKIELDAYLKSIGRQLGDIGHNNGAVAEEYFYNVIADKMQFAGVQYDEISGNLKKRKGKLEDEFDIVLFNGTSVALIETKYKVHINFLDELVTKKIGNFRTLFPHYANYKIYLGVASMAFTDDVVRRAQELGVGVIKQKGDTIEYENDYVKVY